MSQVAMNWLKRSFVAVAAAALSSGCADQAPLGPDQRPAFRPQDGVVATTSALRNDNRAPDLGACDSLQVPASSKLTLRVYAQGVQIYHWNGTSWSFDGPLAVLSADAEGRSTVGTHYSGPTWESVSGSKVIGTVLRRCTPDATAIPWLLLGAVSNEGPGIFQRVTLIQRINTVGGNAPASAGSFTGQEVRVPYTTEYLFYRDR